jgi:hypothetical protein
LYQRHIVCHFGANGTAGGEKEIGYINFAGIGFVGDDFAVLIYKRKGGNFVVLANVLHRTVNQFGVYIGGIVNG